MRQQAQQFVSTVGNLMMTGFPVMQSAPGDMKKLRHFRPGKAQIAVHGTEAKTKHDAGFGVVLIGSTPLIVLDTMYRLVKSLAAPSQTPLLEKL